MHQLSAAISIWSEWSVRATRGTESGADTAMLYKVNHASDWSSVSLQFVAARLEVTLRRRAA